MVRGEAVLAASVSTRTGVWLEEGLACFDLLDLGGVMAGGSWDGGGEAGFIVCIPL